jgi:hypothetical protein
VPTGRSGTPPLVSEPRGIRTIRGFTCDLRRTLQCGPSDISSSGDPPEERSILFPEHPGLGVKRVLPRCTQIGGNNRK